MTTEANSLLRAKRRDIRQSQATIAAANGLLKQIDAELAAKLITSDQAVQRRVALQSAINSVTDSKMTALTLDTQIKQAQSGSETLNGSATSVTALDIIRQGVELRTMKAQLLIQLVTAESSAEALKKSIDNADRILTVAKHSPYYRALHEEVNVAFVPYSNLENVKVGDKIYDCYLQVIFCREVGSVKTLYEAEEYAKHPLFKTDLRGRLVEIEFTDHDSSKSQVVFIGGKPLLI